MAALLISRGWSVSGRCFGKTTLCFNVAALIWRGWADYRGTFDKNGEASMWPRPDLAQDGCDHRPRLVHDAPTLQCGRA